MAEASPHLTKEPDAPVPALTEEDNAEAYPGGQILKNLVILPPLQKSGTVAKEDAILLPPIRVEEPVSSIRQALSDVCGYAHLTNFRFALEEPPKTTPKVNMERPTVSPYTGRDAVVSVPVAIKSLAQEPTALEPTGALDDYGDLQAMLPQGIKDGSGIRIVLERYDVSLVKDHLIRLRSLLDGNAPSTISLDEGSEAREKSDSAEETQAEGEGDTENEGDSGAKEKDGEGKTNGKEEAAEPPKKYASLRIR